MSQKFLIFSALTACLLSQPSCNLKPVFSSSSAVDSAHTINSIEIEPINSVEGAEFFHHLSTLFPAQGVTKYLLKVNLSFVSTPVAIQKNSDILRQTLSQLVEYHLYDKATGKQVTGGKFKHISSYATTFTPYASYIESESALQNLSRQAAEDIRTRLILYFENKHL